MHLRSPPGPHHVGCLQEATWEQTWRYLQVHTLWHNPPNGLWGPAVPSPLLWTVWRCASLAPPSPTGVEPPALLPLHSTQSSTWIRLPPPTPCHFSSPLSFGSLPKISLLHTTPYLKLCFWGERSRLRQPRFEIQHFSSQEKRATRLFSSPVSLMVLII